MPKIKTRKSALKRFRKTVTGKFMRKKAFKAHLLEKKSAKQLKRKIYAPLESLFLEIGTEFMKNMSTFLSANPTEAAEAMKNEIDSTIAKIRTNGDEKDVEKLEHELTRVTAAGGVE
mgnify:CR=1 FL=1